MLGREPESLRRSRITERSGSSRRSTAEQTRSAKIALVARVKMVTVLLESAHRPHGGGAVPPGEIGHSIQDAVSTDAAGR